VALCILSHNFNHGDIMKREVVTNDGCILADKSRGGGVVQYDLFLDVEDTRIVALDEMTDQDIYDQVYEHSIAYGDQANDFDWLAVEYKNPKTSDRRRGEIYLIMIDRFHNLVKGKLSKFCSRTHSNYSDYYSEGLAIWRRMVGEKLSQWDGHGAKHDYLNFLAYLKPYAEKGVVSELNEKHAYKDGRYSTTDTVEGSVDILNTISQDSVSFRAYEASLMASAFKSLVLIKESDLNSFLDAVDYDDAVAEIDGDFSGRNTAQWEDMEDSHKRIGDGSEINVFSTSQGSYHE